MIRSFQQKIELYSAFKRNGITERPKRTQSSRERYGTRTIRMGLHRKMVIQRPSVIYYVHTDEINKTLNYKRYISCHVVYNDILNQHYIWRNILYGIHMQRFYNRHMYVLSCLFRNRYVRKKPYYSIFCMYNTFHLKVSLYMVNHRWDIHRC